MAGDGTDVSELAYAGTTMRSRARLLKLSTEEHEELERLVRQLATPQGEAIRARIVLGAAAGRSDLQLARELHTTVTTVRKWQRRWEAEGPSGILIDRLRSGRPSRINEIRESAVIDADLHRKGAKSALCNSRSIAAPSGLSPVSVEWIWSTYGLSPVDRDDFLFSTSPELARGLRDFVGLYISPSQRALLVSADELDCPASEDQQQCVHFDQSESPQARTADACLDRVNTLMVALSLMCGEVIDRCPPLEGNREFLDFLEQVDLAVGMGLEVHSLMDNYEVLRSPHVRTWIGKHPRYHMHFASFGTAWLAQVSNWLDEIRRQYLQHDAFLNSSAVVHAMLAYTSPRNSVPGPFKWAGSPSSVRADANPVQTDR